MTVLPGPTRARQSLWLWSVGGKRALVAKIYGLGDFGYHRTWVFVLNGGAMVKAGETDGVKATALPHVQAVGEAASRLIDQRIVDLGGWRGAALARMRVLILEAAPGMVEEWKWMGTPVWSYHRIVCTGESYAKVVKLTFAQGAKLADPAGLFNASLAGNTRRAIDIPEGTQVDAAAFRALVQAAVALNLAAVKSVKR